MHVLWDEKTYSHNKRVGNTSHGVGKLETDLSPMMIHPSAFNICDTVESCNALLGEETGKYVADNSTNCVRSKDLRDSHNES